MRGEESAADDRYDDDVLRGVVVELLWLVSVRAENPAAAVERRQHVLDGLYGRIMRAGDGPMQRAAIYGLISIFGNQPLVYLSGSLVSRLLGVLNARNPNTNSFTARRKLLSLIRDIISANPPPSTFLASSDHENMSDLTCNHGGVTADAGNTRGLGGGHSVQMSLAGLHLQEGGSTAPAPAVGTDSSFAGGLPLSDETSHQEDQQQTMPTDKDEIIARFRGGDFETLEAQVTPERVIAALSSGIQIIRSLLAHTGDTGTDLDSNRPRGHSKDDFSQH
jgi:hypothetical protein